MLKQILIIAAALFLVGGIVFFIAFAASGFNFNGLSPMTVENKTYTESATNPINSITLKYLNADVKIAFGDTLSVSYPTILSKGGNAVSEVFVTDTNGKLTLSERIDPMKSIVLGDIKPEVVISVPRDRVCDFRIETENGSVTMEGEGLPVGSFIADTDNGNVTLNKLSATAIHASTDNGFITVTDATASVKIALETDNGEIEMFGNITAPALEAETSTGDISHENGAIFSDKINITTEIGDIEATLAGSQSDYTILIEKSLGTSNVSNATGGSKRAELETDMGDIEISFLG